MPFATPLQFVIRVTERQATVLTNLGENRATHIDPIALDRFLISATNYCQGYTRQRYPQLSDADAQTCWLSDATVEIAAEMMRQTYQPEFISPMAENYRGMLRDLARGIISLSIVPPPVTVARSGGVVVSRSSVVEGFP